MSTVSLPEVLRAIADTLEAGNYREITAVAAFEGGHIVIGMCADDILAGTQALVEKLHAHRT